MKWTKRDITRLKKLWNEGLKLNQIAKSMKRTPGSVSMKINGLQKLGELDYRHNDKRRKGLDPAVKKAVKDMYKRYPATTGWPVTSRKKYHKPEPTTKVIVHEDDGLTNTQKRIERECDNIKEFLIRKNKAYGDSALAPIRIFSEADVQEQIKVRIDDKLNRLVQGKNTLESDEDVIKDLIGYLVLLLIQMKD